jgi:DNA-binding response OmpR family regulator
MSKENDNSAPSAPSGVGPRVHKSTKAQARNKNLKRILIVDDDRIILKTTAAKLKAAGYEVLTAEDGGSAIRQARQLLPHLILLDLNFPPDVGHGGGIPWDGLLILSWIRRTVGVEKIPVIVITGGDLEKYKARFVEAGVLDVFLKPIDHEALVTTIRWAIDDEEVADQKPTEKDPSGLSLAEPSPVLEPAPGQKILFVDDSSDWRYLATTYLTQHGYEVVTAEDPVSAMLQISRSKPTLVVLDLNLGGQSAVPLLKALSELHPDMPILLHTGMELTDGEVTQLLNQGGWGWLPKGSMEDLVKTIETAISGPRPAVPQSPQEPPQNELAMAPQSPLEPSQNEITLVSREAPENSGIVLVQRTEPPLEIAPPSLPSLDNLRTQTTEELLSAVAARSVTPEPPPRLPETPIVVPSEVIESAAGSVLIVEDDASFSDTLRAFLESQSFHVTAVATGAEAMCMVALGDPELILFDLTLPDYHVQEFYEAVKKVKPHLCPKIVFMTSDDSHAQDDSFVRRLKGISLWKPFPMDWLTEALQTFRSAPQKQLAGK